MSEEPLYTFPPSPSSGLSEWPGTPLGVSNTITRTKGRTAVHNKTVDESPGLLEKLLASAHRHLNRMPSREILEHDVMIHGIRVRATTNSVHLFDFWKDNWYSLAEWRALTGQAPPAEPQIKVFALLGVQEEAEAAYYSHNSNTIVFFNTSYYGQLKSWVLGAVGRILAAEYGIHSIHGACVEKKGKGVLYIAPTGTGKSTSSYGLMEYPETRFHSDDWVYVRYTFTTRDGRRVFVLEAEGTSGEKARGYQVYRWIESHQNNAGARLRAMTFDNAKIQLSLGELDLARPIEAYAYTSEKVFYLRTNLAENFPLAAFQILASKEENVPDVTRGFIERHAETLIAIASEIQAHSDASHRALFDRASGDELRQIAGRLIAFDNARSMLDIAKVLPRDRVYTNPMEPVKLAAVMLLKRNADDPTVFAHALLESFMDKLLIGETPDKKREIAYNAYRAVDDQAERAYVDKLMSEATPARPLYSLFGSRGGAPQSLLEEFELFRVMYYAARTYDLNTTLQKDPSVHDKRDAVRRTMAIISRALDEQPVGIRLTLDDYAGFIA